LTRHGAQAGLSFFPTPKKVDVIAMVNVDGGVNHGGFSGFLFPVRSDDRQLSFSPLFFSGIWLVKFFSSVKEG
jgi:hypothetical protein